MATSTSLPRFRTWTAVAVFFLCLPFLVVTGKGGCPLLPSSAASATAHPTKTSVCHDCCPTTGNAIQPSAPRPSQTPLHCCDAFKAYLSGEVTFPKIVLRGETLVSLPWLPFDEHAVFAAPVQPGAARWLEPPPPSVFVGTVSRRCHRGNAPPSHLAV